MPRPNPLIEQAVDKKSLIFGLTSVFLCGVGFGIIAPVVPFLVQPYTNTPEEQAIAVTLLTSVYAFFVFFSAPGLGALSDRFGRRPLLIACLVGSALGYIVFGIGGALWILFAGRMLEGLAGGSIGTLFAYFADITPQDQRTKYFGWMSAVSGVGFVIGPTLGGLLAQFGYSVPLFFGAAITLLNAGFGFLVMPESLDQAKRLKRIALVRLNPFTQLKNMLALKRLRRLFVVAFLLWLPAGSLQAITPQFTIDAFDWEPAMVGLVFSIIGFQDIVSQIVVMPVLLKRLSDKQIAMIGMTSEFFGYGLVAASALFSLAPLFVVAMFVYGFGDSIFGPSYNGMLSKSVDSSEQGRVLGGSQSIQALARIIGPLIGGQVYVLLGQSAPAFLGVVLIAVALPILKFQKMPLFTRRVH